MSDTFASDLMFEQHVELREAFSDWTNGTYPHAKTIGEVVLRRRQDALIDGARTGWAEQPEQDLGESNA